MKALALICDDQQQFTLTNVVLPNPSPRQMVVRTLCSGISVGTEFALIRNKISWGPYPLCTGYQGVGVVEQIGKEIASFKTGDLVYYRDNRTISLLDGRRVSMGSLHAAARCLKTWLEAHSPGSKPLRIVCRPKMPPNSSLVSTRVRLVT
jgi:NADPH:quinone reductase-like Zn-dependent oxidoreductase